MTRARFHALMCDPNLRVDALWLLLDEAMFSGAEIESHPVETMLSNVSGDGDGLRVNPDETALSDVGIGDDGGLRVNLDETVLDGGLRVNLDETVLNDVGIGDGDETDQGAGDRPTQLNSGLLCVEPLEETRFSDAGIGDEAILVLEETRFSDAGIGDEVILGEVILDEVILGDWSHSAGVGGLTLNSKTRKGSTTSGGNNAGRGASSGGGADTGGGPNTGGGADTGGEGANTGGEEPNLDFDPMVADPGWRLSRSLVRLGTWSRPSLLFDYLAMHQSLDAAAAPSERDGDDTPLAPLAQRWLRTLLRLPVDGASPIYPYLSIYLSIYPYIHIYMYTYTDRSIDRCIDEFIDKYRDAACTAGAAMAAHAVAATCRRCVANLYMSISSYMYIYIYVHIYIYIQIGR